MAVERLAVDTWGWLALADDREARHAAVRGLLADLWKRGGGAVTTDYVLDETYTLVFRRLPFAKAKRFLAAIDRGEQDGSLRIERIVPERFARARALRLRLRDKPLISFTDLTTMVVMQELRLTRVVTADAHFRHVGMGFDPVPAERS
jgi:predicted nucleic acid-binding protein